MTVFFIGAGPGDPELITVKGQRLVRSCPVILYAGSLVPAAVLEGHSARQVVNTADLARHRATMAIHLGVRHLARIVDELRPHYGGACPIAVIYRASWPDEEKITGTLDDILGKVQSTQIERTALILVGEVLAAESF